MTRPSGDVAGALPTLPLELRNRLSELIIRSLFDTEARRTLIALDARCRTGPPKDWLGTAPAAEVERFCERVRRAAAAVAACPFAGAASHPRMALQGAAGLFDAGLYFEVHELLEPHWIAAPASDREALQGLIQIAVGFQHLANGNLKGARSLLEDGSAKIKARRLHGLDLDRFARTIRATLASVSEGAAFDWARVPGFPRTATE